MSASLLTDATKARIVARLEIGLSLKDAATAAGVSGETAKSWLRRGRLEEDGPYLEFAEAVDEARDVAATRPAPMDRDELVQVVSNAARNGSVAAMKLAWEIVRTKDDDDPEEEADPMAELDQLAEARTRLQPPRLPNGDRPLAPRGQA